MNLARPWSTDGGGSRWQGADGTGVLMTPDGIEYSGASKVEKIRWDRIQQVAIRLPISSPMAARILPAVSALGPSVITYAPKDLEFAVVAGVRQFEWKLRRTQRFSWRVQFVLEDLIEALERRCNFSPLGVPGVLDGLVDEIATELPRAARLMLNGDVPGLNALFGHGSANRKIERLLAARAT